MRTNIFEIQVETAAEFGISLDALTGKSRFPLYSVPRQVAMYLARTLNRDSYQLIGNWFERDHTTVRTGWKETHRRIHMDEEFAARIARLAERLRPTFQDRKNVLEALTDPKSRKQMVMRWQQSGEIANDEAEDMIAIYELEAA